MACLANTLDRSCTKYHTSDDDSLSNHFVFGLSINNNLFDPFNSLHSSITPFPFQRFLTLDISGSPDFESLLPL